MENVGVSHKRKITDFWPIKIVADILTSLLTCVVTHFVYLMIRTSVLNGRNSLLIFHKTGKTKIVSYKRNHQRNKDLLTYESADPYCNRVWNQVMFNVHGKIRKSCCMTYDACSSDDWGWVSLTSVVAYSDLIFITPIVIMEVLQSVHAEVHLVENTAAKRKQNRDTQNHDRVESSQYWDLMSSLIILVLSDYENIESVLDGNSLERALLLSELYQQIDQLNRPKACSGCQLVERTLYRLNKSEELELEVEYLLASCMPGYRVHTEKK